MHALISVDVSDSCSSNTGIGSGGKYGQMDEINNKVERMIKSAGAAV